MNWLPEAVRDGIIVVLIVSGPLVLAAAAIGLVIGILQAATQVQEQTIGSALKIIGVFAIIIFAGFWMYQYLNQYTSRTLSTAFTFVPRQTQKVIPKNLKDEEINKLFEEKIKAEPIELGKTLKVAPPEEIETKLPGGGIAPSIPTLGAPDIVRPPSISNIIPPKIPTPPTNIIKPSIPLKQIEPRSFSQPTFPSDKQEEKEILNGDQINLVPGEPSNLDLWQRNEVFSETANNIQNSTESNTEPLPTWLE